MNGMNAHEYRSDKHPVDEVERLKKALSDLIADMELCCYPVMVNYSGKTRFSDYNRALADAKKALKGEAM